MASAPTPGRKFFDEHMAYIYANKIDEMIDDQYAQDAVLISPFNVYPNPPPPHIIRGNAALKKFFRTYIDFQGSINVEEISNFAETAFWQPHLLTGPDGTAAIELTVPDSVTAWNVFALCFWPGLARSRTSPTDWIESTRIKDGPGAQAPPGDHARADVALLP